MLQESVSRSAHTSSGRKAKPSGGGGGADKQMLKCWWNYFTKAELAILNDPKKSMHVKMTIMVERGSKVGVTDPDEQLYKWALAFLLTCHYDELPPAKSIYDKLQDLKATWSSEKKSFFLDRIDDYPDEPQALPPKLFAEAYTEDEPPCSTTTVGIKAIADSIPLRSNSKLLKSAKATAHARRECEEAFQASKEAATKSEPVTGPAQANAAPIARRDGPLDDDESVLQKEYELKLAQLRANKSATSTRPVVKPEPHHGSETLQLRRSAEGGLRLSRRSVSPPPATAAVKPEPEALPDAASASGKILVSDLDPFAQSAIAALDKRAMTKEKGTSGETQSRC